MRAEPRGRIDPRALKVWRLTGGIASAIVWLIVVGVAVLAVKFEWLWVIPVLAAVFALVFSIFEIAVAPTVRWRRWRYEVSEREIDMKYGVFIVKRTLVPMVRVQHVDTNQGPILRRYKLATVSVSTAAGSHEIPALPVEEADELRDKIAQLAGIADDV